MCAVAIDCGNQFAVPCMILTVILTGWDPHVGQVNVFVPN